MATTERRVEQSGAALEVTDVAEFADNLGATLVVVAVVQVAAAFVGVAGVGPVLGLVLTVALAALGVACPGWLYLREPRRVERVLRRLGRVLAVVYVLWGATLLGAWTFGIHLAGVPGVLTPPVHSPPVVVAAVYVVPAVVALGLTRRVRGMNR